MTRMPIESPASIRGERALWNAVLLRALFDAQGLAKGSGGLGKPEAYTRFTEFQQIQAQAWFRNNGEHFQFVCYAAGLTPEYVRRKVAKIMLIPHKMRVDQIKSGPGWRVGSSTYQRVTRFVKPRAARTTSMA